MGAWGEGPLDNDNVLDELGDLGYLEDFDEIPLPALVGSLEKSLADIQWRVDEFRGAAHVMAVHHPEAMAPLADSVVEGFKAVLTNDEWLNSWMDREIVEAELRSELEPWGEGCRLMDYEDYDYDSDVALKLTFDLTDDGWFADVSEAYSGSTTSFVGASPLELMDGALEWAQSTVTVAGADSFMEALQGLDALKSEHFEVKVYMEPRALVRLLATEG